MKTPVELDRQSLVEILRTIMKCPNCQACRTMIKECFDLAGMDTRDKHEQEHEHRKKTGTVG